MHGVMYSVIMLHYRGRMAYLDIKYLRASAAFDQHTSRVHTLICCQDLQGSKA